ncbi:MAG: cell division protein FtsA [Dehalococcoidales bacterium]|nr:cell division protein FtsA [Dehalococcoidales bacterium]
MKRKIASIDVGTTKICTIMGILESESGFRTLGVGISPSRGIEKALVTDFSQARDSIRQSIHKAQVMAGYRLESAYVGVTGRHINSINSKGTISITRPDLLVRDEDMKRAVDVALNIQIPPEHKVLYVIPRSCKLDGFEVKSPVGMNGNELEIDVHIITASTSSVQNLIKVIKNLGVNISDLVLEPLASAEAVLTEEEKMAGVMIADIGGGTTDMVVIKNGSILHTSVLPAAGHQITTDIVAGMGLSYEMAEEVKKIYGTLIPPDEGEDPDKTVGGNGHRVSFQVLCEVVQARVEEIIRLIMLDLPSDKYDTLLPAGVVLTGGCANIPGIVELTQKLTGLPVRVGIPRTPGGIRVAALNDPAYATSVGLVYWSANNKGASTWFGKRRGFQGFFDRILRVFK